MNHWLKRILLIAPPVIVVGVYFNLIPVSPSLQKSIDSVMGKNDKPVEEVVSARVEKVWGEVTLREATGVSRLKGGETLKAGVSLTTGEKSSALLTYHGTDKWTVRIGEQTQVNVDELLKTQDKTSVFNLIRGGLSLSLKSRPGGQKVNVRTKFVAFSIRGTLLSVLTDGADRALMTVHDGTVEAENFKMMEKTLVRSAHTYLVNREGEKKVVYDLSAVDLYNWNITDPDMELPALEDLVNEVGDVGQLVDESVKAHRQLLEDIDTAVSVFRHHSQELTKELENLKDNATKSREGLEAETVKVNKDIHCLETSPYECNLFSERVLQKQGFPRLWGNPRYRQSMVVGLQKYLKERNAEVSLREDEARELETLVRNRDAVLRAVETDRKTEKGLEKLIPALENPLLRR